MKKCPAGKILKQQQSQVFYASEINSFPVRHITADNTDLSESELVARVVKWWKTTKYSTQLPSYDSDGKEKHQIQLDAIVDVIKSTQEMDYPVVGVELGAGKGTLSAALHTENPSWYHLLVDIQKNFRNKAERKLFESEADEEKFKRIHINIADLLLDKAIEDQFRDLAPNSSIVLYAKHLCGHALDLGLNCVANSSSNISLIAFATCCHHRCKWDQYCSN